MKDLMSDTETIEQINVLFVSATVPYPATDGGRIRVLNLVRGLCRIHKVTFLTFISSPIDEQGVEYLREMGVEVIGVRWKQQKLMLFFRSLLQFFFGGKPLTVAKYYSAEMVKLLENLLSSRRFNIIHFEMLHTGQYLLDLATRSKRRGEDFACYGMVKQGQGAEGKKQIRTVLGEQNIDSNIWYRLAKEESNLLRKLIFYSQYRSFMIYESRICNHFDMCVCVSEQDQRKLASLCPGVAMEVVPNGVDPDYFKPGESKVDEISLVFTGSMDWQPNEDAVLYFCDQILPFIRAKLPGAKFYIVGSNPTDRVLKLRTIQGVIVTGSVEDVRPYIVESTVYVVPLRIGGGTRLKILQALAMEKAVVSTSIGCEGLGLQPGKHLLVADDPEQFAAGTIQLIKDTSLRRELGENGRILIQEKYDWNIVVRKLDSVYRNLICSTSFMVSE